MILTRHSWLPRNGDRYVRVNHIIDIINSIVCDSLLSRGKKHDIDSSEERKVNLYSSDRPPDRRWFTGQADRIQRMTTRGHQTRVEAFKLIKIVRFFFMWVGSEWNRRNNTREAFSRFEVYKYKRKWIGLHIREVIETFKALKPLVYLFWIFSGMMDWMEDDIPRNQSTITKEERKKHCEVLLTSLMLY